MSSSPREEPAPGGVGSFRITFSTSHTKMLGTSLPALARKATAAPPLLVQAQRSSAPSTFSTLPFNPDLVDGLIDPRNCSMLEVLESDARMYQLLIAHIAKSAADACSFRVTGQHERDSDSDSDDEPEDEQPKSELVAGLGVFTLADLTGAPIVAIHQTSGEAVANACGGAPVKHHSVVLLKAGRAGGRDLRALVDKLAHESCAPRSFVVRSWVAKHRYWNRKQRRLEARPLESVVLPDATKRALIDDVTEFLSGGARAWYKAHGIPYKRSYLFHGVPGAGKTSLIQALAGHFRRDVCFLQPAHPDMTDDCLKAAIEGAPPRAMIVLEDVDALFHGRARASFAGSASPLTFSGLLNALDGVGSAGGRLFVLTTNHREKLDPALIRCGRVDMHVHFDFVVDEQLENLFRQFYPDCGEAQPAEFAAAVRAVLDGRPVAAAAMQALFIRCRRASATEAIANVAYIVEELDSRDPNADEKWRKTRNTSSAEEEEE